MRLIPPIFSGIIAHFLVRGKNRVECRLIPLSEVIQKENINQIDLLKIDCEGAEWSVLKGINDEDWSKIKSLVIEVHDIEGRLENVRKLLQNKGFTKLHTESEVGLEDTGMFNIFALR